MNKKLLFARATITAIIILNFSVSFRLETEAECLIMFLNFLLVLGYLGAEMIIAREEAE